MTTCKHLMRDTKRHYNYCDVDYHISKCNTTCDEYFPIKVTFYDVDADIDEAKIKKRGGE